MAKHALTFGYGGYADLAVTFGEFVHANHTLALRFMPQYPYGYPGPMLTDASGTQIYSLGQGDFRSTTVADGLIRPSTLHVQIGRSTVVYQVTGFVDQVDGPVGYRDVWQHLAVVRDGNAFRVYLNGHRLSPFSGSETFPAMGLPSDATRLRVGRRGLDQFYGLIADVAVYTRALTGSEIATAAAHWLTGSEQGLLAGFTFDSTAMPPPLDREVTLPTAADVPDYVTPAASLPVPVHLVTVSSNHDSAADRKNYDLRPSKVAATLPFCAGEWWHVTQGHDDPTSSHNGSATFSWT